TMLPAVTHRPEERSQPVMPSRSGYDSDLANRRKRPVLADGTPRTTPWIMVSRVGDGWHQLSYVDEGGPRRTNRPPGVDHLDLSIVIGPVARMPDPNDPSHRREKLRRNPVKIEHDRARNIDAYDVVVPR